MLMACKKYSPLWEGGDFGAAYSCGGVYLLFLASIIVG